MQESTNRIDWLSIGQLAVGVLSCLISFTLAILLVLLGASGMMTGSITLADSTSLFLLSGLAVAIGMLNIPSAVLAGQRLRGIIPETKIKTSSFHLASYALVSLPLLLLGGHFVSQTALAWLLLPFINVLALVIPIWWIVEIGRRQLPSGSPQRSWGLISVSLAVTPFLTMLVELFILVIFAVIVFMLLSAQPIWMDKFNQLLIQLNQSDIDAQFLQSFLKDLLASPLTVAALVLAVGGIMPLIEELLKPLGLWALWKRKLSPAEGFSAGLLCGAGFALIESAAMVAQISGGDWAQVILLRISTSLLHITTSGMVGWGLASAWSQKNYGRTVLSILGATFIHGLWNTLAILIVILPFLTGTGNLTGPIQGGMSAGIAVMSAILILLVVTLTVMNRHLHKEVQSIQPTPGIPPSD